MKNKELLLKAKASILANPSHFDMSGWVNTKDWSNLWKVSALHQYSLDACGTTACIAGWIVYHGVKDGVITDEGELIPVAANNALELPRSYTNGLFFLDEWPPKLATRYRDAKRPATRARIAAERIDRFIAEQEAA
jgi:hypothetical protein